jgi:hypothetical protein
MRTSKRHKSMHKRIMNPHGNIHLQRPDRLYSSGQQRAHVPVSGGGAPLGVVWAALFQALEEELYCKASLLEEDEELVEFVGEEAGG